MDAPMLLDSPYVHVREPHYGEMDRCCDLVRENWGDEAAERCWGQFVYYWMGGMYAPKFLVACDDLGNVIGFAAYQRTMLMKGAFDLIWIAVDKAHQGTGVGDALTRARLDAINEHDDAQMVQLVTQKPAYFSRFGFFKLHHVGNEWYIMLKLLKTVQI